MHSYAKSGALLLAAAALVCACWTGQAQKTATKRFQQSSYQQSSSGSAPQSVYGGYQSSSTSVQRQQTLAAPQQATYSVQRQQSTSYQQEEQQAEADAEPASYGSVSGQPGVDFPNYTRVPKTSFSCSGVPYEYGMYADEETGCQAYHLCYNGRRESFLCATGTVFNQRILHCDYWYSVDCGKSSQYYSSNAYMGSSAPEPGPAQASGTSSYKRTEYASSQSVASPQQVALTRTQQESSSSWKNSGQVKQDESSY